jgi:shikimate dehydrogenase
VNAATRLFALLGDPVAHSISPTFQNAAIRAAGLDAVYLALRCGAEDVPVLLRALARAGGGGNVTLPHKSLAAASVQRRTPAVERTGACNTFWLHEDEVWGDNTDVEGVRAAIQQLCPTPPRSVLLLGAGGAASAVMAALEAMGAASIGIANRHLDRAQALADRFARPGLSLSAASTPEQLGDEAWDLAINATSLGLKRGEAAPAGDARFLAALDLVYAPGGTDWIQALRARGVPCADGTEMLLRQGGAAFRRWFGREPDLDAMRRSIR